MKNLITRTLTAVVFCFVVLYSMMDGLGLCGLLFGLFAALGLREFYQLGAKAGAGKPFQLLGIVTGMMLYTLTYGVFANWWGVGQLAWLVFPVIAGSASWLLSKKSFPLADLSLTWLGVIYVVFPFVLIPALGGVSGGYDYTIPLGVILLVWANDTGAYL
ncbi:MAG: phosphatidate cytidylyltransferase, partial [Flavobacteriales bacterium]|nr:phosphatidate cytidylyltransferase [Flavobacteriales bacterium]